MNLTEKNENKTNSTMSILIAMFAAIITVSRFVPVIPVGPIPIAIQNMMAILSGTVLGSVHGAAAVGLFICAGVLGLPVFSGGMCGLAALTGPTGGYIMGYFLGALIAGIYAGKPCVEKKTSNVKLVIGTILGYLVVYFIGVIQFMNYSKTSLLNSITVGVIPFLAGDVVKIVLTIIIALKLRPIIGKYL